MGKRLTIQEFSTLTGVSKSALRYYESIDLLHPVGRNSSGYRVYAEEQVRIVKLISSLRLADIPIQEIRVYMKEQDASIRKELKKSWIELIKNRRDVLDVSLQFLESDHREEEIYLIEKQDEIIVWFIVESEMGKFGTEMMTKAMELKKHQLNIQNGYLKYISGMQLIKAKVGFGVAKGSKIHQFHDAEVEYSDGRTMYVAMPFREPFTQIKKGYEKMISYAIENNWEQAGSIIEWYRGDDFSNMELLMPVIESGERRRG